MSDDYNDEILPRLRKNNLYELFNEKCANDGDGKKMQAILIDGVKYCYYKTKAIIIHMPEYTLHDSEHLFRVLHIMGKIISNEVLEKLTAPELLLLILCAFFHDIGMAPDEVHILAWKKNWDLFPTLSNSEENNEYLKFKKYLYAHPDIVQEIDDSIDKGDNTKADQLKAHIISEYIRFTHSDRAIETIKRDWDGKIVYQDVDITIDFSELCKSHCEEAMLLTNMDYCFMGNQICLPFIGVILRLADIFDFDSKRTPEVLFSHLYVRNPVSLKEWNKHRAVKSWSISNETISYHARCSHPAIEASIHDFCDVIDNELKLCNNILGDISVRANNRKISFRLPMKVTRDGIVTKKDYDGKPLYHFTRTQFSLSKRQVIDLLMGTKLYGNPEVALRELIQNSNDACLLREALEKKWGNEYRAKIEVKYYHQDESDYLEVNDNGVGMDLEIIDKYYSKIGSSFYTSPDFYEIKAQYNPNFSPNARFGIGILSCFMVADTIITNTKRIKGPAESSESLNITIEGQESIFLIKKGEKQNIGTNTCLILREKNPWKKMSDSEFVASVKKVIPNPPFSIEIITNKSKEEINDRTFYTYSLDDLKRPYWEENENLNQINININKEDKGFIGIARIGLLEKHKNPTKKINVKNIEVNINNQKYTLEKEIEMIESEIRLLSASITVDDDENIEKQNLTSTIADSKSRISLHGIEVPTSLFPRPWEKQNGQAQLLWPFPMLIILDVCGNRDLNLNSSRSQILSDEKWFKLEEDLVIEICSQIKKTVGDEYWQRLVPIIKKTKNEIFLGGLEKIDHA